MYCPTRPQTFSTLHGRDSKAACDPCTLAGQAWIVATDGSTHHACAGDVRCSVFRVNVTDADAVIARAEAAIAALSQVRYVEVRILTAGALLTLCMRSLHQMA